MRVEGSRTHHSELVILKGSNGSEPFLETFWTQTKKWSLQHLLPLRTGGIPIQVLQEDGVSTALSTHMIRIFPLPRAAGRFCTWNEFGKSKPKAAKILAFLGHQNGSSVAGKPNLNKVAIRLEHPGYSNLDKHLYICYIYNPWWAMQRHSLWVRRTMIYLCTNLLGSLSDFNYTSLFMQPLEIAPARENCLYKMVPTQATYGTSERAFDLLYKVLTIKICESETNHWYLFDHLLLAPQTQNPRLVSQFC